MEINCHHLFVKNIISRVFEKPHKKLYLNQLRYSFASLSKALGYTVSVYMCG